MVRIGTIGATAEQYQTGTRSTRWQAESEKATQAGQPSRAAPKRARKRRRGSRLRPMNFYIKNVINVEEITVEFMENTLRPAMTEAIEMIAQDARDTLQNHRSEQTGTRDLWSDAWAQKQQGRKALADSIETDVRINRRKKTVQGKIVIRDQQNRKIARFLEFGVPEGNKKFYGTVMGAIYPIAFLRSAYFDNHKLARTVFAQRIRRDLQQQDFDAAKREEEINIGVGVVAVFAVIAGGGNVAKTKRLIQNAIPLVEMARDYNYNRTQNW